MPQTPSGTGSGFQSRALRPPQMLLVKVNAQMSGAAPPDPSFWVQCITAASLLSPSAAWVEFLGVPGVLSSCADTGPRTSSSRTPALLFPKLPGENPSLEKDLPEEVLPPRTISCFSLVPGTLAFLVPSSLKSTESHTLQFHRYKDERNPG